MTRAQTHPQPIAGAPTHASERGDRALARLPFYPLLLAAWPVLRLYGDNANEFAIGDLVLPLAVALGLAIGALMILTIIWREPRRAAIVASAFIVPFLTFGLIASAVAPVWPHEPIVRAYLWALVVWLGVLVVAAYVASKLRGRLGTVTEAMNLASTVLLIVVLVPVVGHQVEARPRSPGPLGDHGAVASVTGQAAPAGRDIYHIVLDRYGSRNALSIGMGIDNSEFVESLRERGFQVVDDAHADFERTVISLASTFSMSLLDGVVEQMGPDNPSWTPLYEIVKASPVGSLLQDLGYRYIHVGSWYQQTAVSDIADQVVRPAHLLDFQSVLLDQSAVTGLTMIGDVITSLEPNGSDERLADATLTQLAELHAVADQPGPKYVFAHLLVPHEPYLLLGDGTFSPATASFASQLEFANRELDKLLDQLLDVPPDEQPIIILQADEGPYPASYQPEIEDFDWEHATNEELVTKFGVLDAMYLPGPEGERSLPDGMTLVDTYPEILERYFGIDVERSAGRIFVSPDERPYDLLDITDQVQRAELELGLTAE